MRAAIYARVSTLDQEPENQLQELRRYAEAREWTAVEHVDRGVSGARESRPALDALMKDARRRRFDVLVVWRLDRLGRSLRHLILLLEELSSLGVGFVSLHEGIDATTPAGRLQMHILGAIAEFERARIAERVRVGMARAKAQGKHVGRPRPKVSDEQLAALDGVSVREAASRLGVSKSFVHSWRLSKRVPELAAVSPRCTACRLRAVERVRIHTFTDRTDQRHFEAAPRVSLLAHSERMHFARVFLDDQKGDPTRIGIENDKRTNECRCGAVDVHVDDVLGGVTHRANHHTIVARKKWCECYENFRGGLSI
jgi:DNA invertase Pin-like site-specific DNA recombinase